MGPRASNVTRSLEESADTFFYQVAYVWESIASPNGWVNSVMVITPYRPGGRTFRQHAYPRMETETFKKPWYQGDTIPVGIGQGY